MQAKTVNEVINESSPGRILRDNPHAGESTKDNTKTKTWKLLKWLGEQPDGATLTEIQHYIFVDINHNPEEEFWEKSPTRYGPRTKYKDRSEISLRKTRGYWNTQLFGTDYNHGGLLHVYCEKVGNKWVLKRMPTKDELMYDQNTANRHYPWSKSRSANDDRVNQSKAAFR